MGGYLPYVSVRSSLARQVAGNIPKKDRRAFGTQITDACVKAFVNQPGASLTLDSAILTDEMDWVDRKCPMYFPACSELLQMLWKARMDVDLEDLNLPSFPRAFAVSWPDCEVDGTKLRGNLVWWGTGHDRLDSIRRFGIRYMGGPGKPWGRTPNSNDDELIMHISYIGDGHIKFQGAVPYYRCTIPNHLLKACLKSDDGFRKSLGEYQMGAIGVCSLNDEESRQQYVISKLVIRMMVYMRAFPELIHEGYPDGRGEREFRSKWTGKVKPSLIGAPAGLLRGTHDSPETHFRTWHFRSYPRRQDGTKMPGVVFVKAAIVNAELEDPMTVESVNKQGE